jgi:hypothetical protein
MYYLAEGSNFVSDALNQREIFNKYSGMESLTQQLKKLGPGKPVFVTGQSRLVAVVSADEAMAIIQEHPQAALYKKKFLSSLLSSKVIPFFAKQLHGGVILELNPEGQKSELLISQQRIQEIREFLSILARYSEDTVFSQSGESDKLAIRAAIGNLAEVWTDLVLPESDRDYLILVLNRYVEKEYPEISDEAKALLKKIEGSASSPVGAKEKLTVDNISERLKTVISREVGIDIASIGLQDTTDIAFYVGLKSWEISAMRRGIEDEFKVKLPLGLNNTLKNYSDYLAKAVASSPVTGDVTAVIAALADNHPAQELSKVARLIDSYISVEATGTKLPSRYFTIVLLPMSVLTTMPDAEKNLAIQLAQGIADHFNLRTNALSLEHEEIGLRVEYEENSQGFIKNTRSDLQGLVTQVKEVLAHGADRASSPVTNRGQGSGDRVQKEVGGIDLNPELLDLQIKRDGNGVPLPLPMQSIKDMHIEGFLPVIINVTPITNLPLLLGIVDRDLPTDPADSGAQPLELGLAIKEN